MTPTARGYHWGRRDDKIIVTPGGAQLSTPDEQWFPKPSDRIIEVLPPDRETFETLRGRGCTRYLGLVAAGAGSVGPSGADCEPARFVPLRSADEVRYNNADVLILHGEHRRFLWYRQLGRARFVAFSAAGATAIEARLASLLHRRGAPRRVTWGRRDFYVVEMTRVAAAEARHHLSPLVGLKGLPPRLDERGLHPVVLRWFEKLPELDEGEDLDVLIGDDDLEAFVSVLEEEPGTIPVDVYTVSGRPGSDFKAMAYYPPVLAERILARAVQLPSGYWAPSPEDHFASLAYHAVYHKGIASGLSTETGARKNGTDPEHDYDTVLSDLAEEQGVATPLTMERLDEHLAGVGWRPPRDMLARLAQHNPWVRDRFFATSSARVEPPLTAVFLLRDKASDQRSLAMAHDVLEEHGFEVVQVHRLDPTARGQCTAEIRGGNWGPGPFATSGGQPAVALVAIDPHPKTPTPAQRRMHPGLANGHTLEAKLAYRDRLLSTIDPGAQFNPMHSSDSDDDAWHYLELANPSSLADVHALVEARRATRLADRAGTSQRVRPARADVLTAFDRARQLVRSAGSRLRSTVVRTGGSVIRWGVARRVATARPRTRARPPTATASRGGPLT